MTSGFIQLTSVSPLQVASYIKAVNAIYEGADFDGIKHVDFKVKTLSVSQLGTWVLISMGFG